MSIIKVIEDDLRQLLKCVSLHGTVCTMLQLDAATAFLTFASFFLSQHVPPLLKHLSVCRLLNCIGILLCKAEHLLVILEQNASVTAQENSMYGKPLH